MKTCPYRRNRAKSWCSMASLPYKPQHGGAVTSRAPAVSGPSRCYVLYVPHDRQRAPAQTGICALRPLTAPCCWRSQRSRPPLWSRFAGVCNGSDSESVTYGGLAGDSCLRQPGPRPDREETILCDGIEPQQATTVTRARGVAAGPVHGRGEFELGCGGLILSQGDAEFSSESARIRVSVTVRAEAHGFFSLPFSGFKLANHLES